MRIDQDNALPKYLQLKEIIIRYLQEEKYSAGQKLPSETELIAQFEVSRNTVRQALAQLANEGIIYKRKGMGSFFAGKRLRERPHSCLIGVITTYISHSIYPHIIQGIEEIVHTHKYNIVLGSSNSNPEKELIQIEHMLEKKIEGLLIEPAGEVQNFQESHNFQRLKALEIPVVFLNWQIDDPEVSYVSLDDVEGGFMATNYLLESGHRRIACIYPHNLPGIGRYHGYRKALNHYGIEVDSRLVKTAGVSVFQDLYHLHRLVHELLALKADRPSAIFFFSDMRALQGYTAIREVGLSIPEDISVIGFDDTEMAEMADVPLTTLVHPKEQIGKWAAEILFDEIAQGDRRTPRHITVKPTIVERKSVKMIG